MAVVELIYDVKAPAWVSGNTDVPKLGEPVYLTNGQYAIGDNSTQVQNLQFYGGIVAVPNLQQVLSTGSTLTQNNDIDGAFDLNFGYNTPLNQFAVVAGYVEVGSPAGQTYLYGQQVLLVSGNGSIVNDPNYVVVANFNSGGNVTVKADGAIKFDAPNVNILQDTTLTGVYDLNLGTTTTALTNFNTVSSVGTYLKTYDGTNTGYFFADGSTSTLGVNTYLGNNYFTVNYNNFDFGGTLLTPTQLSYVDATSSIQTQLNARELIANKGAANGYAPLDSGSKIPSSYLPALAITDTYVVSSQAAMLALNLAETGDIAVRTDLNKSFILRGTTYSVLADWQELLTPTDSVLSVNGFTGAITLTTSNITEGTNLYYTQGRFDSAFTAKSTTNLSEGTNLYYTTGRVDSRVQAYTGDVTLSGTVYVIGSSKVTNAMLAGSIATAKMASANVSQWTNDSGYITPSSTNTLTNKRPQPRVYTAASASTLTPEIDTYSLFHLTALAANVTIANHSTSTPADGEQIKIRLLDNGTARTITFGTNYVAKAGVSLPTTTTISKNMEMMFEWNASLSKYNLMAVGQES